MANTYRQSTGELTGADGTLIGKGYSGHDAGLNNPAMEADPGVGPIPAGNWHIGAPLDPPDHLGPVAMPLSPVGFDPHGRSAFFMHGDNSLDDESASHGCIVMPRYARDCIDAGDDRDLVVIP
jgi:hypothetical protein